MENVELGNLGTITAAQAVTAIYIGYYDRAPDPAGLNFWVGDLGKPFGDGVFGLSDVATAFATEAGGEAQRVHDFFTNPTTEGAEAFLESLYQNIFGRAADDEGKEFWTPRIEASVAEGGTESIGDIILEFIKGAKNNENGQDLAVIQNKITAAEAWTAAASEVAGFTYDNTDSTEAASAKGVLDGVDDTAASVDAAKAKVDSFFDPLINPAVPGNEIYLTSGTDVSGREDIISTDNDDIFYGYTAQNPFTGGTSNSLSSADRLDGMGGNDTLYAVLTPEFLGATSNGILLDVQPRLTSIEVIELEARDMGAAGSDIDFESFIQLFNNTFTPDIFVPGSTLDLTDFVNSILTSIDSGLVDPDATFTFEVPPSVIPGTTAFESLSSNVFAEILQVADLPDVTFDGKDTFGMNSIGSKNSDGDLVIENINTKVNRDDANGRKTSEITITMDHTDNFNSDKDAADLTVYFDENYLLANDPVQSGAVLNIELMDLDATTLGQDPLLDNPFGLITFTFGGELKTLDFGIESNTYADLLADIQAAIDLAAQTDPDFGQLTASFGDIFQVRDTDNDPDPSRPLLDGTTIVITNSGPEELEAVTMRATGDAPAGKDFHTGFSNDVGQEENFDIEVDIDLHKVGRGGEGGDLIVGGKSQAAIGKGIEVFNVDVLGAGEEDPNGAPSKPSNLGTLTSTNNKLHTVNIATHADFVDGDSWASLTIRNGFDQNPLSDTESGNLKLVDADDFLGDLTLGDLAATMNAGRITNLDTLNARGGGDVVFNARLDGNEVDTAYNYNTGEGDDVVNVLMDGDALDYAGSSLNINTGDGDDTIDVRFEAFFDQTFPGSSEQLNQAVLNNVLIDGGAGDDIITINGLGNARIEGGDGDDVINTSGDSGSAKAIWAFNFDNDRADANTGATDGPSTIGRFAPDELPGVQATGTQNLAYLDGASITVTLSGAGINNLAAGGGVMALANVDGDAVQFSNGYEANFTITDLINGNDYYGDQRDVNEAVIAAIEGHDVLKHLLTASVEANNTLVIESKTSGFFDATDLRIDIEHGEADSTSYANAVLSEARELFGDSSLTLTDLWGSTTFTTAQSYETDAASPGIVFANSAAANAWYDGLSVFDDVNSAVDNLHTVGSASNSETDNVINGGADDDIIVLSTDATAGGSVAYTPGGNNSLLNGASNETIEMDGDFGNDTVMNFTTASTTQVEEGEPVEQEVGILVDWNDGIQGTEATPAQLILDVDELVDQTGDTTVSIFNSTFVIPAGSTEAEVTALIIDPTTATTPGDPYTGGFTAAVDGTDSSLVVFTNPDDAATQGVNIDLSFSQPSVLADYVTMTPAQEATDPTLASFTIQFFDENAGDVSVDSMIDILGSTFSIPDNATMEYIAEDLVEGGKFPLDPGIIGGKAGEFVAENNGDGSVTFTYQNTLRPTNGGPDDIDAFLEDVLDFGIAGVEDTVRDIVAPGLDFLNYTSYLTSLTDTSTNPPGTDSDVSNDEIAVTLDYSETNMLADTEVDANEVAVVRMANDTTDGETWTNLSADNVAALFNNDGSFTGFGGNAMYGNLDAGDFDVIDSQSGDAVVGGAAKAIFMVENAGNLGEYKVFELSWDASEDDGDEGVTASQIGTLDFGTSLTGLDEVNLVGSEDYDAMISNGILSLA